MELFIIIGQLLLILSFGLPILQYCLVRLLPVFYKHPFSFSMIVYVIKQFNKPLIQFHLYKIFYQGPLLINSHNHQYLRTSITVTQFLHLHCGLVAKSYLLPSVFIINYGIIPALAPLMENHCKFSD